jgi:hypothetical protein
MAAAVLIPKCVMNDVVLAIFSWDRNPLGRRLLRQLDRSSKISLSKKI